MPLWPDPMALCDKNTKKSIKSNVINRDLASYGVPALYSNLTSRTCDSGKT